MKNLVRIIVKEFGSTNILITADHYRVYFTDENGKRISDVQKIIAAEQGLQVPQREPFQIDIAFAVDEFDFFS